MLFVVTLNIFAVMFNDSTKSHSKSELHDKIELHDVRRPRSVAKLVLLKNKDSHKVLLCMGDIQLNSSEIVSVTEILFDELHFNLTL